MPDHWHAFFALTRREIQRFINFKSMTIFPQIVSTILYIVIFGFTLGGRITSIHGFRYIEFILPGLVLMALMMSSYSNGANFLFISRYDSSIQDVLLSPLSYFQMVLAYTLCSTIRGVLVGILVLICGMILLNLPLSSFLLSLYLLILTAQIFSSFGIIIGLWAERWDHIMLFLSYIVTPLSFLGGTFYSLDMLPSTWKIVNFLNPFYYMISSLRFGILGFEEFPMTYALLLLTCTGASLFIITVYLFKVGYKLKT